MLYIMKEIGVEMKAEKTHCKQMFYDQNVKENDNVEIAAISFCYQCIGVEIFGSASSISVL